MSSKKCKITSPQFVACELPKIDIKEQRKKVKAYLAAFNVAIKKAIADDELLLLIELKEEFDINWQNATVCNHSIQFTDKNSLKTEPCTD